MPRVVLITNDSLHGRRLIDALSRRGLAVDVLYITGDLGLPQLRGVGFLARLLRWPRALWRTARRTLHFLRARRAVYAARSARVVATGGMHGRRLRRDLARLAPDWIVLGGGGIASPAVIAAARCGVLNAHPALLPWIRGNGVVGASLAHGVALGATVHRVDAGIDTGPIVARRLLAVPPAERDLDALDERALALAATMMADVVEGILRRGELPAGHPQHERYPLFHWPDEEGLRPHRALAAAGRAQALEAAWRPLCVDAERGELPATPIRAPEVMTLAPKARGQAR